ncbi:uncharacterized protein YgiM (DUF1202 family) [Psychrobacillus insolitus]|uniref:Uncharacterized protein YgiM (DUF1202 family) n=1 Tax=Psychrobacillus insolitus TaxID=1461 RepID=A0A2W7MMD3_9BACI|nr:SH3 domain-containing protein [Psychrobacillus insolitus]PZX08287.1 uncharacterized protein YgiM (DUF1202 family) [Psychrobacillus insolitus]
MKKIIISTMLVAMLSLIFSFSLDETANASSFREVKSVNASSLVVKQKPTTSSTTISTLKKGDFVTVFSQENGWASIQKGNIIGYVNASFLTTPKSTIKIANSKSGLVVKTVPSRSVPTSATLQYNMIVEDFGPVGNGWSFVQYGNVTGYVASNFIGTPLTKVKYVNTASGVVVRNIASTSGANIGTIVNGTEVKVHSSLFGWSYVTAGNQKGYVVDKYLSTNKPVIIVETPYKAMVRKVNALISEGRAFTDGSYTIGEIPQGEYAFISLADDFNYYSEEYLSGEIIDNEIFESFGYVYVHEAGNIQTEGLLIDLDSLSSLGVTGAKGIYEVLNNVKNYNDSGMYKVGLDIQAGYYVIESSSEAYVALLTGPIGRNDIIDNDFFDGRYALSISEGQYLQISGGTILK